MSRPALLVSHVLKHLLVMGAVAVVVGMLVAGLAIPFAAVSGLGARTAAKAMDKLPADFEVGRFAETTKILDSHGHLITTIYDQNRVYRPLDQISPRLVKALLAIEDFRFYQHGAIDIKGTLRAFVTNEANDGVVQGGSSLTQQLVKMTLLYRAKTAKERRAATEESYSRKLRELRYAVALENRHSKDWILEHYLNAAYFGDGAYGIQSAAKHYFDTDADHLTWVQSALLAGLVKNPNGFDPTNDQHAAIARRNVVLARMAQLHVITQGRAERLQKQRLGLHVQRNRNGCADSTAPFFCEYALQWLLDSDVLPGDTEKERYEYLETAGLTIKTTLDQRFQRAADDSVEHHVRPTDQAVGALAMVQPGTGAVRAIAQSRPMGSRSRSGQTYLDYVVPTQYGHSAGFQAGSTFKLFVLAAAIEDGVPLDQPFDSPPVETFANGDFSGCPGDGTRVGEHVWHNSTTSGVKTAYTGTRESVNTFYAQLEQITGLCQPYRIAKRMGIELTDPAHERVPTFTLGVASVSPLEMAEAYATVAARGKHCDSQPLTEILDSQGRVLKDFPARCRQVMSPGTADAINDILRGVQQPGGFGGNAGLGLTAADGSVLPSAGKTGTINDNMTVWYCGYTPALATASMIAGANSEGHWITLNGQRLAGSYIATADGSTVAGPMWGDAMHAIQRYLPDRDFHPVDPTVIRGVPTALPDVVGMSVSQATAALVDAGFRVEVGAGVTSRLPSGEVAATSPAGQAASGSRITLLTSTGPMSGASPHHHDPNRHGHRHRSQDGAA